MTVSDPRTADGWQPIYAPMIMDEMLPGSVCDRVISLAHDIGFGPSSVYDQQGVGDTDVPSHRKSETVWLKPEHDRELYRLVENTFRRVNAQRFRFSIYGMAPIQVIRYVPGCFFAEHFDFGMGDAAKRKLSLLVQLSDPTHYEGGEIVLSGYTTMPKTRGAACLFPSWVAHRVNEVKSGTRYSLAAWAKGSYFL